MSVDVSDAPETSTVELAALPATYLGKRQVLRYECDCPHGDGKLIVAVSNDYDERGEPRVTIQHSSREIHRGG